MTKFDLIELSYQIWFFNMSQIWNLKYSMRFWIIKYVGFEPIIFPINLDATTSIKVFSTFDYVFLSIVLLT